jgi:hypothetical protein
MKGCENLGDLLSLVEDFIGAQPATESPRRNNHATCNDGNCGHEAESQNVPEGRLSGQTSSENQCAGHGRNETQAVEKKPEVRTSCFTRIYSL